MALCAISYSRSGRLTFSVTGGRNDGGHPQDHCRHLLAAVRRHLAVCRKRTVDPTDTKPTLEFSAAFAGVAGLVAGTVAAGTASVLGIEIQKARSAGRGGTLFEAVKASWLLKAGVLLYFFVGLLNLLVWLSDTDVAPEMVATFALGVIGWMGGAFAAVFQASENGGGGRRAA